MVTNVNDLRSAYTCSVPSCVGFPSRQYVRQDLRTDVPLVHIPGVFATTMSTVTSPGADGQTRPRRGRRSLVPPELRAQTRRLKKQNLERRRRACISDKMNALHALALDLIGLKNSDRDFNESVPRGKLRPYPQACRWMRLPKAALLPLNR
ncbi:STARP antigen [Clonorchis sinensis]|uniref:STARP antigen n=1 Tax=Clonorchis sinensis TaxID=79923 RepID=G7Y4L2_CLOSI|nr:STARP antigen [Clonorchis sinensis]